MVKRKRSIDLEEDIYKALMQYKTDHDSIPMKKIVDIILREKLIKGDDKK